MHYIHEMHFSLHTRPIPVYDTKHVTISQKIFGTKQQFPNLTFYFSLTSDLESQLKKPQVYIAGSGSTRASLKNKPF